VVRQSGLTFAAAAAVQLLAACGDARPALDRGPGSLASCTACHGGTDNETGAPPRDVGQHTGTSSPGVGAHTAHVQAGAIAGAGTCGDCHPDPRAVRADHLNGKVDLAFGVLATAGGALSPRFQSQTCSAVYCHGAFPGGNAANAPTWTQVDGTQAACGTCHGDPAARAPALPRSGHPALASGATNATCAVCHAETVDPAGGIEVASGTHVNGIVDVDPAAKHPAGWTDRSSASFHGLAASQDVAVCWRCHAAREPALVAGVTCASCHDALSGGGDWTTTCNTCHGSAVNAAPPRDLKGNTVTTARGVGAHQEHVTAARGMAAPLDCTFCHRKPASVLAAGHLDGQVTVTGYTGADPIWVAAGKDPGWSETTGGCATSYCHGAFPGGNASNAPTWTRVDGTQAACGTCHALPPPAPHPAVPASAGVCNACHPSTVDSAGQIIPASAGGKHLDGVVQGFPGHPPGWMDTTSPTFHAYSANRQISSCALCHGRALDGVGGITAVSCASCHGASWKTSCTMCHGGTNDASGAPPRATWGNDADPVRTGAHGRHLVAGPLAGAFGCEACHAKPADALASGHVDGTVSVTGYTGSDPVLAAAVQDPGWTRATATCATSYCHGATMPGGTVTAPKWTVLDGSQMVCGACHSLPPRDGPSIGGNGAHDFHVRLHGLLCVTCHLATVDVFGTVLVAGGKHVNGTRDVVYSDGTVIQGWDCVGCHSRIVP